MKWRVPSLFHDVDETQKIPDILLASIAADQNSRMEKSSSRPSICTGSPPSYRKSRPSMFTAAPPLPN